MPRLARVLVAFAFATSLSLSAQQPGRAPVGISWPPLGAGPFVLDTAEQHKLRVVVVTKGLKNPWSLAFLPDGQMLVTERAGRLRIIRNGVLDPQPVAGAPEVRAVRLGGLLDIVLHPRFAENKLVYMTYSKPAGEGLIRTALARGRWDGAGLTDVRDIFIADPAWDGNGGAASRLAFAPDGLLFMTTGASVANMKEAQDPGSHKGKVLRLNDDGTAAAGNPFVGVAGARKEVFSSATATSSGSPSTRERGPCGQTKTAPMAATKSTSSRPDVITAGPSSASAATTPGRGRASLPPTASRIPLRTGRPR